MIENAEDVLAALRPMFSGGFREPENFPPISPGRAEQLEAEADRIRTQIEEALGVTPIAVDDLIRQIGASSGAVLTVILELELAGRCRRHPGNRVSWADLPTVLQT